VAGLSDLQEVETFGGLDSYMTTGSFTDLIHKHKYRPNIRFHVSRWGRYNNAPTETCTMSVGNINDGVGWNIPMPEIPRRTVVDPKTGRVKHRGWATLLTFMLKYRVIRPSKEIEMLLGTQIFDTIRREVRI